MLTVVTGPPCSGKSTYVRQRARPGDIVVDFDVIARALGSPAGHDHDQRIRDITVVAWSAIVETVADRYPGARAWIVDSRPTRHRQGLYRRAQAKVVDLSASAEELHRRADEDGRPQGTHQEIDRWAGSEVEERTRW